MKALDIKNPFNAPVYHLETVSSTMDAARELARQGENHGTVITADFQEAGRGRSRRSWLADRGKNLLFTLLLRYRDVSQIPEVLTLKTGLAVSLAIEDLIPALAGRVKVKWPNDVMIDSGMINAACKTEAACKAAGILAETDGSNVLVGVGINVYQDEFPGECCRKAGSLIQFSPDLAEPPANIHEESFFSPHNIRFVLLEYILSRLYAEIEIHSTAPWRERLLGRLYKKSETVIFAEGPAESKLLTEGILSGIGAAGELLIVPAGEKKERAFVAGELKIY